jgi:predicted signal transduction protein with EAL and GGDEF domain
MLHEFARLSPSHKVAEGLPWRQSALYATPYRARAESGSALPFLDHDLDNQLRERRSLALDLRSAIDRYEFVAYYQPQARIDGEITGFEALVRWKHPTRGLIRPADFIPLAEETGLILQIGESILRQACREAASWPKPLNVAVNLSPVQLQHSDIAGLVRTVLIETGLSPRRLEIEITESVFIDDFVCAVAMLRRLKGLGVSIAMDDSVQAIRHCLICTDSPSTRSRWIDPSFRISKIARR